MFVVYLLLCVNVAIAAEDGLWYSYQFGNADESRDELIIDKVDADDDFTTAEPITKWKSLSVRSRALALGLSRDGLTLLSATRNSSAKETFNITQKHNPMKSPVLDVHLFEYSDRTTRRSDAVALVLLAHEKSGNVSIDLKWYNLTEDAQFEKPILIWNFNKNVTYINVIQLNNKYNLIVGDVLDDQKTLAIYEFTLGPIVNYWLVQVIQLDAAITSTALMTAGPNVILAIPQESKLQLFQLIDGYFQFSKNITFEHVRHVSSFRLGSQSYLAIDGLHAGIYKFAKNKLVKEQIADNHFEGVDYWLPMAMKTYRDEEILLAERFLDHGTHKTYMVEAVIYNAGRFTIHDEMVCDYYGDVSNGMNCLVEEDSTWGIKGSAILSIGSTLGILIPKKGASSGLFMLHTSFREKPNPLDVSDLVELRRKIDGIIRRQNQQYKLKHKRKETATTAPIVKQENQLWDNKEYLEELKFRLQNLRRGIAEMKARIPVGRAYKNVVVNDLVEVKGSSNVKDIDTIKFNGESVKDVFEDVVSKDNVKPIHSLKSFQFVDVGTFHFDTINGIAKDEIAFANKTVRIKGDVVFANSVSVEESMKCQRVNGLIMEREVIEAGKDYNDSLSFDQVNVLDVLNVTTTNSFPIHSNYLEALQNNTDFRPTNLRSVYFPGNVTVRKINGEDLDEVIASLCLTNIRNYVPSNTTIIGDLIVKDEVHTVNLNKLSFLKDYLFGISNSFAHITGRKTFTQTVHIHDLVTFETIGGVDPNELVTLSTAQEVPGKFTFQDFEVTESLNIEGNVTGVHLEDFLPNLGITKTTNVISDVNFKHLEVDGTVYVENRFNRSKLYQQLDNVIYKNEDFVEVHAVKDFVNGFTVHEDLNLLSNKINNLPIESLIHRDRQETLNAKILNGSVTFENLEILGLVGGVNVTSLEQETVKLSGEQFISATLYFEEDLTVEETEILGTLNDVALSDYFYTDGDRDLLDTKFEDVKVAHLHVEGNLAAEESNVDLEGIEAKRLSYTKDQTIDADYSFNASNMYNLRVDNINEYAFGQLFDVEVFKSKLEEKLKAGKLKIERLIVEGPFTINSIDGIPMTNITKTCIWSKKNTALSLQDNVYVKDIQTEYFNDIAFDEIMSNVVFKNETDDLTISGFKVYTSPYDVLNYMVSPKLNGIKVENVLLKTGEQRIKSPLVIFGDVLIRDAANVEENINDVPADYLTRTFETIDENTYKINENVMFNKISYMKELKATGLVNGLRMADFMENRIDVQQDQRIAADVIFRGSVTVDSNLIVRKLINGVDMLKIKDELLLVTQDGIINVPVEFKNPVAVREEYILDDALIAQYVDGINVSDWVNAIYINQGLIPETIHFEHVDVRNKIEVETLNGISMKEVIPLKSDQVITQALAVDKMSVFRDIPVGNLVNNLKLQEEYLNSVISNRNQRINSKVVFQSNILVRDALDVFGPINGQDVSKIVTTNTVQNLSASYQFSDKMTVANHVVAYGLINGINVTNWIGNAVYKYAEGPQVMKNPWKIARNITFGNNVVGSGQICGFDIRKLADQTEERRIFKTTTESEIINQYGEICNDINTIITASRDQIYLFNYLDHHQSLEFENDVAIVHKFEHLGKAYMLVSEANSCKSSLFIWAENGFQHLRYIETGPISQLINVYDGDLLFLVSRSDRKSNCSVENSNVWKFDVDNLLLLFNIDDQSLLQDSKKPGTFYAMDQDSVSEFRLITAVDTDLRKVRKWYLPTENAAFIPRGLKTSLAVRNGRQIFYLSTEEPIELSQDLGVIVGNVTAQDMHFLPGRRDGEIILMNVGYPRRKTLLAYATHEETSVKGRLDFIKIYENILSGTVFHKVPTYKPSSLVSLEFGENGETLLVFMEDEKYLQIYEYKGIEGFKYRTTAAVDGKRLVPLVMPKEECQSKNHVFIGSVNGNRLSVMQAVMEGDKIELDNFECDL